MPRASAQELLTRARQKPNITVSEKPAAIGDASVPRPLGRLLPGPLESLDWSAIAPGVKQFDLGHRPRKEGAFKLLRLEPGVALTPHSHNERELTYVVRGSYTDEIGQFCAGDIADLDECDEHCPIVDEHEVCYAVVATDAPVRYSTMLGKIMQPFVGI